MKLTRITVNPRQMGGVPCIRGLRITVAPLVGMLADGMTEAEILQAIPTWNGRTSGKRCSLPMNGPRA